MLKRLILISLTVLLFLLAGSAGFARQPCDPNTDPNYCGGQTPTNADPNEPQPTDANNPPPDSGSDDRDGDGVADYVDGCPDEAGTGFTNGCPVEAATPAPDTSVVFPVSADCLLGSSQAANIRQFPSTSDSILGQLKSGKVERGIFELTNPQGELWYFGDAGGYIRSDVVRTNGNCGSLPLFQASVALLHVGTGVVDGLHVFPLQRNLNLLNVTGGLAVNQTGGVVGTNQLNGEIGSLGANQPYAGIGSLISSSDIEAIAFVVLQQATADAQNDIKAIMQEVKKLQAEEQRRQEAMKATQEAQVQNRTADALATLQATIGTLTLVQRHGDVANCPIFTKWTDYPPEIVGQLERLIPIEPSAPCMVEVLFSDAARPNPTGDGTFEVTLNSLMIALRR